MEKSLMEILMHGHYNALLSVMPLALRLIEIEWKPVSEQALRRRLIQSVPLEALPPVFPAVVEAIKAWDEVAKARDEMRVKVWDNARDVAVKARDKAQNNFTHLCALHKDALEVLHAKVCLAKHPDCPWNGERLVGIGRGLDKEGLGERRMR